MFRTTIVLLALSLAACTQFPQLEGRVSADVANAPPPRLVPLGPIVARAQQGTALSSDVSAQGLSPRLAALRARAARLRGPVIAPAERARMLRAMR